MKKQMWSVLAAGALMLGACGGSDTTEAASGDEAEIEYVSPIGEFLGWDQGADFDQEAAEAEYAQQERDAQEAIATCMVAEGFEYIPVDVSNQGISFDGTGDDGLEWGSAEWTAKYGFGVSTQQYSQTQVGPDLVGNSWNDFGGEGDQPVDPNQAYLDTLGENERMAYDAALWGDPDSYPVPVWEEEGREPTDEEIEAFSDDYEANYVPSGCQNIAYEEIFSGGEEQAQFEEFDEAFGDLWEELEARFESDPEVIAFRADVRSCVEDAGIEYLTEEEAWDYFNDELTAAGLGWENFSDPLEDVDTTDFTEEDFERAYQEAQNQQLPADKLEALAEVQANEIATAVTIRDCGGGWQGEAAALQDVRIALEEDFLAENADKLADFEGVFGN